MMRRTVEGRPHEAWIHQVESSFCSFRFLAKASLRLCELSLKQFRGHPVKTRPSFCAPWTLTNKDSWAHLYQTITTNFCWNVSCNSFWHHLAARPKAAPLCTFQGEIQAQLPSSLTHKHIYPPFKSLSPVAIRRQPYHSAIRDDHPLGSTCSWAWKSKQVEHLAGTSDPDSNSHPNLLFHWWTLCTSGRHNSFSPFSAVGKESIHPSSWGKSHPSCPRAVPHLPPRN